MLKDNHHTEGQVKINILGKPIYKINIGSNSVQLPYYL